MNNSLINPQTFSCTAAQEVALGRLSDLVKLARSAGADAADGVMVCGDALSASHRLGAREDLERSESADIGLRVIVGKKQANVSSTDTSPSAYDRLVQRALSMAENALDDPHCGLADPTLLVETLPDLDLFDSEEPSTDLLFDWAANAEDAALSVDGVANSEGANATWGRTTVALVTSGGFSGAYTTSRYGVSVSVLAGSGASMQRDYDYSTACHLVDLEDPLVVGLSAGERAVRRVEARKVPTAQVPVVFDWRVANSLLRHLSGAINGNSIARETSFLKGQLGKKVFSSGIEIVDDPLRPRGLLSRPCDGEGVRTRTLPIVRDGVLQNWLLDTRTAKQLSLSSTGHAGRSVGGPPMPSSSNFYLEPGSVTPDELISDIDSGFCVSELIGYGVNLVTGDYSRGASGFWIENGKIGYPVHELTIAGNLTEMFQTLQPANDLTFRTGVDSPTVRIDGMTVAGL